MASALELIQGSLRLIDAYSPGETLSDGDASIALDVFNEMIDTWNAQRLAVYTTRSDDFQLIGGQQQYTLGTGGDFDIARPAQIDAMSAILLYSPTNPVEVPMSMYSVEDWQTQIPVKNVPGTFPLICYDTGDFPLRTLNMWPIPGDSINKVRIYSWQALAAQTLAAAVNMPPGYQQAFRFNLAMLLAPEYGKQPSAFVQETAIRAFGVIKAMNMPDLSMQSDLLASPAGYNYKADMFGIPY